MKRFLQIPKENLVFILPFFLLFISALTAHYFFTKAEIHVFFNSYNSPWADEFFKYLTHLGSGWALVFFIVLLVFVKRGTAGGLLLSGLLMNIIVQTLKNFIDSYRPVRYFALYVQDYTLHLVDGVKIHYIHSFPSGHAATAFAIFFYLSGLTQSKFYKFLYFLLATLVAYSRVYLSQHFLLDIAAGGFIGIVTSAIGLYWARTYPELTKRWGK